MGGKRVFIMLETGGGNADFAVVRHDRASVGFGQKGQKQSRSLQQIRRDCGNFRTFPPGDLKRAGKP